MRREGTLDRVICGNVVQKVKMGNQSMQSEQRSRDPICFQCPPFGALEWAAAREAV